MSSPGVRKATTSRARIFALALLLFVPLAVGVGQSSAGAGLAPPSEDQCASVIATENLIEGEVIARQVLVDQFSTNIHRFSVRTDDGTFEIELDGKPELIEVGGRYQFVTLTVGESQTLISSAFGENLLCLLVEPASDEEADGSSSEEEPPQNETEDADEVVEPVPLENGVSVVAADGTISALVDPPLIPESPISTRTFFIGSALFAFVIFLIRFR